MSVSGIARGFAIALSATTGAAVAAIWIQSQSAWTVVVLPAGHDGEYAIEWSLGEVGFGCNPGPLHGGRPTLHHFLGLRYYRPSVLAASVNLIHPYVDELWTEEGSHSGAEPPAPLHREFAGVVFESGPTTLLFVPIWLLMAIALAPGAFVGWRICSRRSRRRSGHCTKCGYDLRASSNRCPECGAPIPENYNGTSPNGMKIIQDKS